MLSFFGSFRTKQDNSSRDTINRFYNQSVHARQWEKWSDDCLSFTYHITKDYAEGKLITIDEAHYFLLIYGSILPDENKLKQAAESSNELSEFLTKELSGFSACFLAVVYDKLKHEIFIIRDQFGMYPFYYCTRNSEIILSSDLPSLKAISENDLNIDHQWFIDCMTTVKSEKWRTPYSGIRRLAAGSALSYPVDDHALSYLDPDLLEPINDISFEEAKGMLQEKLVSAVHRKLQFKKRIGIELSGGLDSAAITSIIAKSGILPAKDLFAFTHAFSPATRGKVFPYTDEFSLSAETARSLGIENHILCDADQLGIVNTLKENILLQGGPTQQGFSMLSGHLYEAASVNNVEYLFSGFGGDEGISSRATGVFYDFRMQGEFRILREELFQYYRLKQRKQYSALLRYLLIRYFPAVEKQFFNRLHSRDPFREYVGRMAIQKEFVEGRAAKERFVLLKEFHLGKSMLENQFFRLSHNHVSQRLEYSSMDAAARGIQYLYPLFDVDLVNFYLRLPTSYKFSNGRGRAIFREALRPYLPDEIRNREVKSIPTIPTVYQRVYNDYETLKELIERSRDFSFHYLDPDKMFSWLERIRGDRSKKGIPLHPMAFLNSIQVLLLQEMQKNGEYNSGIRC